MESASVGSLDVSLVSGTGLRVATSDVSIQMSADWRYNKGGLYVQCSMRSRHSRFDCSSISVVAFTFLTMGHLTWKWLLICLWRELQVKTANVYARKCYIYCLLMQGWDQTDNQQHLWRAVNLTFVMWMFISMGVPGRDVIDKTVG